MNYRIIDGSDQMDLAEIMRLLKMTYWADQRSVEQVSKSVANSSCYGVYLDDEKKLIGFARVISDYATIYYLCDVIIDTEYQHRGFVNALVSYIESLPEYEGLRGIFVLPSYQGRGIGRLIIDTLEADEYFRRAWRTEVGSSLTAVNFYRKMGYEYKSGVTEPDKDGVVRLEKRKAV